MNSGKDFEAQFKDSIPDSPDIFYYLRLKDSANSFNKDQGCLRFTLHQPYDCQIYKFPNLNCFELKSKASTSLSIQTDKKESGKDIKLNQIEGLLEADKCEGVSGGFIINFRLTNNTYWLWIKDFQKFRDNSPKKSINEKDVVGNNAIPIGQSLKRIKYVYDIEKLLKDIWDYKNRIKREG